MARDPPSASRRILRRVSLGILALAVVSITLVGIRAARASVVPEWPFSPALSGTIVGATSAGILVFILYWFRIHRPGVNFGRDRRLHHSSLVATVFGLLGLAGLFGWITLWPSGPDVAIYIAIVGLFGAVVSYLVLPGRTLSPLVADGLYEALGSTAIAQPAKSKEPVAGLYVPTDDESSNTTQVRPFNHQLASSRRHSPSEGTDEFGTRPSGDVLYREFKTRVGNDSVTTGKAFAWQLCRALTDWFELTAHARPSSGDTGTLTVRIVDSAVGSTIGYEHPTVSFLAVAFARWNDMPVVAAVHPVENRTDEYRIECRTAPEHTASPPNQSGKPLNA